MRDSEYILDKVVLDIAENLKVVEDKMIRGSITSMEDYKFNLGMRHILSNLQLTINDLIKRG